MFSADILCKLAYKISYQSSSRTPIGILFRKVADFAFCAMWTLASISSFDILEFLDIDFHLKIADPTSSLRINCTDQVQLKSQILTTDIKEHEYLSCYNAGPSEFGGRGRSPLQILAGIEAKPSPTKSC